MKRTRNRKLTLNRGPVGPPGSNGPGALIITKKVPDKLVCLFTKIYLTNAFTIKQRIREYLSLGKKGGEDGVWSLR